MTYVYELIYDHQYDGQNYGLFSSINEVEKFLFKNCGVTADDKRVYSAGQVIYYGPNYRVERKAVK